jgi:hypothetical protein
MGLFLALISLRIEQKYIFYILLTGIKMLATAYFELRQLSLEEA